MRGRERGVVAKGEVVAFRLAVREALDQDAGGGCPRRPGWALFRAVP